MIENLSKKQFAKDFEKTLLLAKAKAYSKTSLERELTTQEFNGYKQTMSELGIKI